jgi:hypothetical protein
MAMGKICRKKDYENGKDMPQEGPSE